MPAAESAGHFIDSNVLIYSWGEQDDRKREVARTLAAAEGARLSTQVLSEFANVLTGKLRMAPGDVRDWVERIARGCEVVAVTPGIVADALRIMERYRFAFFDAQIVSAALAADCAVLYSEDLHDGQVIDGTLTIRSPFKLGAEQRRKRHRIKSRRPAPGQGVSR